MGVHNARHGEETAIHHVGATKEKVNKWFLAYAYQQDPFDLSNLVTIEPPEGTYWADPFLVGEYIFFEDYDYDKGSISYVEMGVWEPKKILEGRHFSYPAVMYHGGSYYMTPECGNLVLYKAIDFPDVWVPIKMIAEGTYADPTLFYNNGEWLLFTTIEDHKLVIFRADYIEGEWERIYSADHMNSRGAGNLFWVDGRLMRPCQNCENGYGKGIVFKEIQLAPYREKEVKRQDPVNGWDGMHTFNFNEYMTIVDGRVKL